MARKSTSAPIPNREESLLGFGYLLFQLILLPSLLNAINGMLPHKLSQTELNFTFFLLNFIVVWVIFHRFLGSSVEQLFRHPGSFCEAVILGTVAYYACTWFVTWFVRKLDPSFTNANDSSLAALSKGSWYMMAVGTVILVPLVEECFYRALVFRRLYGDSHAAAYLVSMAFFSLIHIIGHIGSYSPLGLVLCFLQYLPAGLCLAWSYVRGDTIFAPIVIHAFINARSIYALR